MGHCEWRSGPIAQRGTSAWCNAAVHILPWSGQKPFFLPNPTLPPARGWDGIGLWEAAQSARRLGSAIAPTPICAFDTGKAKQRKLYKWPSVGRCLSALRPGAPSAGKSKEMKNNTKQAELAWKVPTWYYTFRSVTGCGAVVAATDCLWTHKEICLLFP